MFPILSVQRPLQQSELSKFMGPAGVGATVGFVVDTTLNPLLRARTVQAVGGSTEYAGLVKTLKFIAKSEGYRGWYRGVSALAVFSPIGTSTFFTAYHQAKKMGSGEFLAGVLGQIAGAAAGWVPCAVLTEARHMTKTQAKELYGLSTRQLIKHIASTRGVLGFYPGFWTQNVGYSLFNGMGMWASAETTSWLKDKQHRELSLSEIALVNAGSFGTAAWLTTIIDNVKICYQMDRVKEDAIPRSPLNSAWNMYKTNGFAAFSRGWVPRVGLLGVRQGVVVSAVKYFTQS
jgi:hypothetical protein